MLHAHHPEFVRYAIAAAMVAVGLGAFVWPRCFAGAAGYFTRWSPGLAPAERERVSAVVHARENAEGISPAYGRYLGVAAILLAGLEALPSVPFIVPYALFCLAGAGITVLSYLQFRRAVEQRVAPLVRRSPFAALPLVIIGAVGCSFVVAVALAAYPPERLGALVVAAATLVLGVVAWRVAAAPALLVGKDPRWEYAVDEQVRIGRARTIANLACAPAFVLIAIVQPTLPDRYAPYASAATVIVAAAFLITLVASVIPLRRRIRVA